MPRYYFDVHDGRNFRDEEGLECFDLSIARREALRAAGSMLSEKSSLWSGEQWTMTVRDENGTTVATLSFSAR